MSNTRNTEWVKQLLIIGVLGFLFLACSRDELSVDAFGKCNGVTVTDSLALSSKLTGTWKWTEELCGCCPGCVCIKSSTRKKADKNVIAAFTSDATFSVSEDQKIITTGEWRIIEGPNGFRVSIEEQKTTDSSYHNMYYLDGYISVCENILIASHANGCSYLFVKTN